MKVGDELFIRVRVTEIMDDGACGILVQTVNGRQLGLAVDAEHLEVGAQPIQTATLNGLDPAVIKAWIAGQKVAQDAIRIGGSYGTTAYGSGASSSTFIKWDTVTGSST